MKIRTKLKAGAMKLLASITLMTLAGPVVAVAEDMAVQGAFSSAFTGTLNTGGVSYCDPTGTIHPIAVESEGGGFTSLGALLFTLQKTVEFVGAEHGCVTLTAPNGDVLKAVYTGTSGGLNSNNFATAVGMLVFTGGTGRFKGATGSAKITSTVASFYPQLTILVGGSAPAQGMAFHVIAGTLSLPNQY
jgi:hypothetical protein